MAARKGSRPVGQGMSPLFDVAAFAGSDNPADPAGITDKRIMAQATTKAPKPVDYWVRGRFSSGEGEHTHTVRGVGMSDRLEADVARFVRYLTEEGWQFAAGRATLVAVLGVGADDGVQITLSHGGE